MLRLHSLWLLALPPLASTCGMTLHSEVAIRAHQLFATEVANISSILARYPDALVAGAPFPDYLYACGTDHGAGEDAHWHTFHSKAAKYIREKYPNWQHGDEHGAKLVAFMLGAVSHYAADMNWHGQRVKQDNRTRNFGLGFLEFLGEIDYGCQGHLCPTAHSEGDTGGEFMIHHQLLSTSNIEPLRWFIPVADLVEIFHREPQAHPNVTSTWIIECGLEFRAAVEAVHVGGELLFPKYARPGPFLQEQLLDFWIGGFDDMAHFSLVAWRKFLDWLLHGPPEPAPPRPRVDAGTHKGLQELMALGKSDVEAVPLPGGAVAIGSGVQSAGAAPIDMDDSWGSYAYEGTSVLFCDVDGDGEHEEVSGAPGWSLPGQPLLGQVLLRKPSTGATTRLSLPGMSAGGRFGHSLACGDFDGDGIDDLAVSSPTKGLIDEVFERQAYSGQVDVFFGSAQGLSTSAWTATATGPADVFGHTLLAVPGAAGAALLAVGSPYFGRADDKQLRSGMVHLFEVARGQHLAPEEALHTFAGWQPGEKFGTCLCAQGDRLFIGAPGHFGANGSAVATGGIYLASQGRLQSVVSGHLPHGRFGHACAILGERLVVSQPGKSSKVLFGEDSYSGAVLLLEWSRFDSNSTLRGDEEELWHPQKPWGRFGWSIATNGRHLAVGAPFAQRERGTVFLYDATRERAEPVARFTGTARARMGWSLSMASTVLAVGSPKSGASMMGSTKLFQLSSLSTVFA